MMPYVRSFFLALILFSSPSVWAMGHLPEQKVKSSLIGAQAPDVVLSKTDETSSSVVGSRDGKKAILVFWATWCPHCYEEVGTINDSWAGIEQKGIKIILVDIGETRQVVKDYFAHRQINLNSFIDENSFLQETYHLTGVPTLVFINEKGIICSMTHEFPSDYENYFRVQ